MRSSIQAPAFVEGRSDETDSAYLMNNLRRFAVITYRDAFLKTTALSAAPAAIWISDDMPQQSTWEVTISIVGHATDGSSAGYQRVGRFKRGTGISALIAAVATPVADAEDVAGWDVALTAVGNGAQLTVTGDVTRTVNWLAIVEIREVT